MNLVDDPGSLERAANAEDDPLTYLEHALIVHLNSWREKGGLFAAKAWRYGWRHDADLVPEMRTVRAGVGVNRTLGVVHLG